MTCGVVKKIVESKGSFAWKQQKLCEVIETLTDQAAQGNFRNIGVITQSIEVLNRMDGHHAPISTINVNIGEDDYVKRLNTVTLELIKEKRNQKLKEVGND